MMQHRRQQAAGLGLRCTEAGLQFVAQYHQLIHFGDNAVLLGKRWDRHKKIRYVGKPETILQGDNIPSIAPLGEPDKCAG